MRVVSCFWALGKKCNLETGGSGAEPCPPHSIPSERSGCYSGRNLLHRLIVVKASVLGESDEFTSSLSQVRI